MATAAGVTRRQFVLAGAAAGGALVLGVTFTGLRRRHALQIAGHSELNAYVRVARDGTVTLVMPKVEMGQGTYTSLPMLIAEELEVDLEAVSLEAAPPNPAVYGFAPDPSSPEGLVYDQATGTSLSIIQCWQPLRQAGANARVMLIQAAAQRWGVSAEDCHAAHGQVHHAGSARSLSYGALAAAAARLPLPAPPPALKDAKTFSLIGRPTPRRDTPDKVSGRALFGIDIRPANAKVAVIARSPVEGGTVAALATDAALAVRGVHQVVNEGDFVAVVAANTWTAMQGMKALAPRWSDGPNGAVQQASLVSSLEAAVREPGVVAVSKGNLGPDAAHGARHLEAIYHQPFLAHGALEPMNCTLEWRQDACEIWTGTQVPDRVVLKLAALGLKPQQIRLHNQLIGGAFGRRLEVDGIVLGVRLARQVPGPVRVLWTREQDIQHDQYRPYYVDRLSAALDARGRPSSWRHTIAGAGLWALYYGEDTVRKGVDYDAVTCSADLIYPLENLEVRFVRRDPQGVPTGWWRGVGATRSIFPVESFIDELAAAARTDPVQYRRALISNPRLLAVLDLATERAGWGTPLPPGSGRGVSLQHAFGSYLAQVVEVRMDGAAQPRGVRVVCAMDCGQVVNPDTVVAQLEGGATFGLSAALGNEITFADGRVQQSNFHDFPPLRMSAAPRVEAHLVASSADPGGVGETGTACVAAALCNAIYAACGKRLRTLPVSRALRG
jgi:isoquinoline 1-oxidoreductase beta subunit